MILSSFLFFITAVIWAIAGNLDNVLLLYIGAIIFGISDAFLSGTNEALMFETVEELKKQGIDIDKKKICVTYPIDSLGTHNVKIQLHKKVEGEIKVTLKK